MVRLKSKKSLLLIALFATVVGCNINNTSKTNQGANFNEGAVDLLRNETGIKFQNESIVGNDSTVSYSKTYAQYGVAENGNYCIRFATAIKGELSSLKYTRFALEGDRYNKDVITDVTTIYKGISVGNLDYYYNGDETNNNGLTTNKEESDYYWACYTIRFSDYHDWHNTYIKVQLTINDIEVEPKRTCLNELMAKNDATYLEVFEAEHQFVELAWAGASKAFEEGSNASNGGHIGNLVNGASLIKYYIESPVEQSVTLSPRIAFNSSDKFEDQFTTYVNGNEVTPTSSYLVEQSDKSWYNWGAADITATLNEGLNVIAFRKTNAYGSNFDNLSIKCQQPVKLVSKPTISGYTYEIEGDKAFFTVGTNGAPSYNGGQIVNANGSIGATITYKVNASEETTARMYLSLGMGGTLEGDHAHADIDMAVLVNGEQLNGLDVASYVDCRNQVIGWNSFNEYEIADLSLVKGENEIKINIQGDLGNIDYMKLVSEEELEVLDNSETRTKYRIEAEDCVLTNGESSDSARKENGTIGWLNKNNNTRLAWGINAEKETTVRFGISSSFGDRDNWNPDAGIRLFVNGERIDTVPTFMWQETYSWDTYYEIELNSEVVLKEGLNSILFEIKGECGNLDYIYFYSDANLTLVETKTNRLEAEDATKLVEGTSSPVDENCAHASNGKTVGWLSTGLTWKITVSEDTYAKLYFKLGLGKWATATKTDYSISINETTEIENVDMYNGTDNEWNNSLTEYMVNSNLYLTKGTHEIKLDVNGTFGNLDYIEFESFTDIKLA